MKKKIDNEAVKAIGAEIEALCKVDLHAADFNARFNALLQRLHRAMGLSEEEIAEIERETEMQVQLEDEAFFNRLPEDTARALRAIVEGDKTKH